MKAAKGEVVTPSLPTSSSLLRGFMLPSSFVQPQSAAGKSRAGLQEEAVCRAATAAELQGGIL